MPPSPSSHTIDTLYAVGRNVVGFQRLEQILKRLCLTLPVCAPLSKLQSKLEKRKTNSEFLTLRNAVEQWIGSAYEAPEPQQGQQPDNEIMVTFGFELPWSQEYFDELSVELDSLAQERNNLIHVDLAQLNFEDEAESTELRIRLDAQNDRIERASEVLRAILTKIQNTVRLLASDEVQEELRTHLLNLPNGSES